MSSRHSMHLEKALEEKQEELNNFNKDLLGRIYFLSERMSLDSSSLSEEVKLLKELLRQKL
jgi:hypothetical protein